MPEIRTLEVAMQSLKRGINLLLFKVQQDKM